MRTCFFAVLFLASCPFLVAQQSLNNDSVVKLVKAGLSDDLIVSTINAKPGAYDTSTDSLIALKVSGVGDKVVAAMVAKGAAPPAAPAVASAPAVAPAPIAPPPAADISNLPQSIDEVYYKDASGAWVPLQPENIKMVIPAGDFLKMAATGGIAGGGLNGEIQGGRSPVSAALPVKLLVYVPAGATPATEYQMLRLHAKSHTRQFSAVKFGLMDSMSNKIVTGKDAVPFQSEKIAPRVYQLTLDSAVGRGEYGILPPSPAGDQAPASKIYCFSVN